MHPPEGETYLRTQQAANGIINNAARASSIRIPFVGERGLHFHLSFTISHIPFLPCPKSSTWDTLAYPPPLTTFVVFLSLHPNCSARVGQHASSNSCIPPYSTKEGVFNVTYYKGSIRLTILICDPASCHARKI
ncbi:hypothetical protein F5Y09DRAFT_243355 [Xylaria sp. FL1042]|nr:hypothetical protein F5Y09DRAFT_243355 [Xylaria sp. FL1042]